MPTETLIAAAIGVFGLAFGAWAWVVAWGVGVTRHEIAELKKDIKEAFEARAESDRAFGRHITHNESRLATIEADFRWLRHALDALRTSLDTLFRRHNITDSGIDRRAPRE